jgi:NhaP-type Na+/H+ and K+/H+ antiporter
VSAMLTLVVKPQWVRYKLDETIEQSCSDFLAHTLVVFVGTMSIQLSEDNHGSWVTCTTSAECKTVITAVLTVMSGMDPHKIRWNLGWVWFGLVGMVCRSGSY